MRRYVVSPALKVGEIGQSNKLEFPLIIFEKSLKTFAVMY